MYYICNIISFLARYAAVIDGPTEDGKKFNVTYTQYGNKVATMWMLKCIILKYKIH